MIAWLGIWLIRPLATFFHELGHSLVACFLTSSEVSLRVGRLGGKFFRLGKNLSVEFSFRHGQEGLTTFSVKSVAKYKYFFILAGGPFSTLLFVLHSGYLLFYQSHGVWVELPLISWFCCHSLTFFRSVIPMRLKPTESFPKGPPSDGLQIYIQCFQKKKESSDC
ncbi:hypothetical protein N9J83_06000 [Opitutales bacterium]|nr:hypothetical protein [Opitutales bacterium]